MLPDLQNNKVDYPFIVTDLSNSSQLQFVHSIKDICICTKLQGAITARVIYFSPEFFSVQLIGDDIITFNMYTDGTIQNNNEIYKENSFVIFSSPITGTRSCSIKLLPQTVLCVPSGLFLKIGKNTIQPTAKTYDIPEAVINWISSKVNFTKGFNFKPFINNNTAVLAAGAGLGQGTPTAFYLRNLLQQDQARSDSYYAGIRNINGQTAKIDIQTSKSLYTKIATEQIDQSTVLKLSINRKDIV